jgi:hypothetical protein
MRNPRTSRRRLIPVWTSHLMLVAVLGACSRNAPPPPEPGTKEANVIVTVQNQNTADVDVFANINGLPQRLGTVTSQQNGDFEINWDQIGPSGRFSVVVSPIGSGGAYRSGALPIGPGQQVAVQVAPVLRNSTTQVL